MNKKRILIIGVIAVLLIAIGIGVFFVQRDNVKQEEEVSIFNVMGMSEAYSKIGFLKIDDSGMLSFTDAKTNDKVYVCNKANCEHEPYDETSNPDPSCSAALNEIVGVAQWGDSIYLIGNQYVDGAVENKVLYREDLDGSNRKKLVEFEDSSLAVFGKGVCSQDYLSVTYYKDEKKDKNGKIVEADQRTVGACIVNLKEGTCENFVMAEGDEAGCTSLSLYKDKLYYSGFCTDDVYDADAYKKLSNQEAVEYKQAHMPYMYGCYNIREQKEEFKQEDRKLAIDPILYEDYIIEYTQDRELRVCNEKKNVCEVIMKGKNKEDWHPLGMVGTKVYYARYDANKDKTIWYVYDMNTKKSEKICSGNYIIDMVREDGVYAGIVDEDNQYHCKSMTWSEFKKACQKQEE